MNSDITRRRGQISLYSRYTRTQDAAVPAECMCRRHATSTGSLRNGFVPRAPGTLRRSPGARGASCGGSGGAAAPSPGTMSHSRLNGERTFSGLYRATPFHTSTPHALPRTSPGCHAWPWLRGEPRAQARRGGKDLGVAYLGDVPEVILRCPAVARPRLPVEARVHPGLRARTSRSGLRVCRAAGKRAAPPAAQRRRRRGS